MSFWVMASQMAKLVGVCRQFYGPQMSPDRSGIGSCSCIMTKPSQYLVGVRLSSAGRAVGSIVIPHRSFQLLFDANV